MSFILFNKYNFRLPSTPPTWAGKKKPVTLIVIVGEITSSNKYNNLNDGKAMAIKIKAMKLYNSKFASN